MACSARLCLALRAGREVDKAVADLLAELSASITPDEDDFWKLIESADATMMATLAQANADATCWDGILARYRAAWRHVGSPLKLMSVREQLEFYEDVIGLAPGRSEAARTALDRIGDVRKELEQASGGLPP